jgi:hypothetical protein
MVRLTKRIFGFLGFLVSVWIYGKGAQANFIVRDDDLAAASGRRPTQTYDAGRFARTGEVARTMKKANLFAYACLGYASAGLGDSSAAREWHQDSTYFYCCGVYGAY